MLSKSQFRLFTSRGNLPAAWTASVWNVISRSFAIFPISPIGKITPVPLLTYIIVMSMVFGVMASLSRSRLSSPSESTFRYVTSKPSFSRYLQVFKTAGCSTLVVIMWLPFDFLASAAPFMARLSPSLPQLVNITSTGEQFKNAHTFSLASSTAFLGALAAQCMLEGLPHSSFKKGSISSNTSGCTGVVALWSMYIFFKEKPPDFQPEPFSGTQAKPGARFRRALKFLESHPWELFLKRSISPARSLMVIEFKKSFILCPSPFHTFWVMEVSALTQTAESSSRHATGLRGSSTTVITSPTLI